MHVFHTDGAPPKNGIRILPMIGCTKNNNVALMNIVIVYAHRRIAGFMGSHCINVQVECTVSYGLIWLFVEGIKKVGVRVRP